MLRTPDVFARLMLVVCVVAGLAHVGFIVMFLQVGVSGLAVLNVASVLLYVLAGALSRRGQENAAMLLVGAEVLVHGVVATAAIGWGAGFHHYIVLTLPFAVVRIPPRWGLRMAATLAVALGYLGLDFVYRRAEPAVVLPRELLDLLHYANVATMMWLLSVLALTYHRLVRSSERRLHELACTDALTGLRNRRFMMEEVQREVAAFARDGRALCLLLGDADHFKRINDQHGHDVGDAVLRAIAQVLRDGVREADLVARWGGEEFLVLLPRTRLDEARQVAERLRAGVQALTAVAGPQGQALDITLGLTLGATELRPGESVEQALKRVDQALYEGKQSGRNRVVLAGQA